MRFSIHLFCLFVLFFSVFSLLEILTKWKFQVFCYALSQNDGSEWRQRTQREAEHFIDVSSMSSDMIARMINEDRIQILINLNGYTKVLTLSLRCLFQLFNIVEVGIKFPALFIDMVRLFKMCKLYFEIFCKYFYVIWKGIRIYLFHIC